MEKYSINYMNYDVTEGWETEIIRPKGSGDYDFILFKCNLLINLDGKYVQEYPNSCIIYTPDSPQYYRAFKCKLRNDYVHFKISKDNDILSRVDVPFNKLFYPVGVDLLSLIVERIQYNLRCDDEHSCEDIDYLISHLLISLSREYKHSVRFEKNPYKKHLWKTFNDARREILKAYNQNWSVDEMAKLCNMSSSRFSVLYKEFFDVSPVEDLIITRIDKAKYMLTNENKNINDIASMLGYNNIFHFIRQFKQRTGSTPSQYRAENHVN